MEPIAVTRLPKARTTAPATTAVAAVRPLLPEAVTPAEAAVPVRRTVAVVAVPVHPEVVEAVAVAVEDKLEQQKLKL